MSKLEIRIDASSLSDSACLLAWHRRVIQGYTAPLPNAAMVYGIAVHKYIDTCYQRLAESGIHYKFAQEEARKAFNIPKYNKSSKSDHMEDEKHMLTTAQMYWTTVIEEDKNFSVIELGGKPATEFTFEFPYYEDDFCIVYLCGTIDRIGRVTNGIHCIRDFKTTSTFKTDIYLSEYELSAQLRFYTLFFKLAAQHEKYKDTVIGKIGAGPLGCFIDGIFLKPKAHDNVYESSRMFRFSDEEIAGFKQGIDEKLSRLIYAIKNNTQLTKEGILAGSCKKPYWNCDFWSVCACDNPSIAQTLLSTKYKQRPYNPLAFNDH